MSCASRFSAVHSLVHRFLVIRRPAKISVLTACIHLYPGVKYTAPYTQCAIQEYFMQAGSVYKAAITVLICGVSWYVTWKRRPPSTRDLWISGTVTAVLPTIAMAMSVSLRSARLYCNVEIKEYEDTSASTKRSILAYYLCFQLFVQLCAFSGIGFFIVIYRQLQCSASVNMGGAVDGVRDSTVIIFVKRLILFPLFFFCGWLPDAVTLFIILLTGKDYVLFRLFANAMAGSVGLAISLSYFYFQIPPKESPSAVNYFRQTIFKSPAFVDGSYYNAEDEPMWSGHAIRDTESFAASMGPCSSSRPTSLRKSRPRSSARSMGSGALMEGVTEMAEFSQ